MFDDLPKPKNELDAWRQANVWERAQALQADGYRFLPTWDGEWVRILKPGNQDPFNPDYMVNTEQWACTCPDYGKHCDQNGVGICKHSLAVRAWWNTEYERVVLEERRAERS